MSSIAEPTRGQKPLPNSRRAAGLAMDTLIEQGAHRKTLFRLIQGFKLTERLFKIELEPDVNTAC